MKASRFYTLMILCIPLISQAQWGSISGEGDVVKQEIQFETLRGVRLGFSGDIILTQGSPQKIVMEGQQNILDNIKREVTGGIWKVNYEKNVRNAKPVKIYITLATLEEASISGSGNITTTSTFQNLAGLEAWVSGSGNVNLSINAGDVETAVSGSGNVELKGSANSLEASISGSGNVRAVDLKTANCDVSISGSGDVTVYCTSSLETSISGSGDVRYKGDAAKVKASVSGSGNVEEID
jgi:hypothetical protein